MEEKRDGIHFDQMPSVLKPFSRQIFSNTGQAVMNRFGVPRTLGEDNRKLVAGSPLLLAVLLDKAEYRPGELSGFYSIFGMGAAVENIWLTTTELGMGIQFVSTPRELGAAKAAAEGPRRSGAEGRLPARVRPGRAAKADDRLVEPPAQASLPVRLPRHLRNSRIRLRA